MSKIESIDSETYQPCPGCARDRLVVHRRKSGELVELGRRRLVFPRSD
jgi:hypothetical protein